jgi:hypothetical protein
MYLSRIEIENLRGFRSDDLRIDLDLRRPDGRFAGWTVIAGRNGTGKTTFLKAIAMAVAGPVGIYTLQQSLAGWIRVGQVEAEVVAHLHIDPAYDHSPEGIFRARLGMRMGDRDREPQLNIGTSPTFLYVRKSESREVSPVGPWALNPQGCFIAGYGSYRRLMGHAADAQRLMSGPSNVARLVSLFREDASLVESIQWLRELHLRRLEKREGAEELLESVLALLNDELLPPPSRVMEIDSEGLWVEQHGVKLLLTEMSDGYRTVAALVMDLVRQLHAAYPEFKLVDQSGRRVVPYPGVVLIDEVELHLHVSWQQKIGFWFKERFPNIQFIVTTHSPFVCQAADPKGLIRLPAPGEEKPAEHVPEELYQTVVNGTVDEAVLTSLFGLEHVHSNRSERLRKRVAELEVRLLDGKASAEEKEELERLAAQLPSTPSALVDRAARKFRLDE